MKYSKESLVKSTYIYIYIDFYWTCKHCFADFQCILRADFIFK